MKKEWFSTTELAGVGGLPSTTQGINQKARREEWLSRKRQGVQGKAVEYHIDSFPEETRRQLELNEQSVSYRHLQQDPLTIWVAAFHQLSEKERQRVTNLILRQGINSLISLLEYSEHQQEEDLTK